MFHALGRNEFVGNVPHHRRLAAHEQHFQAVVVVKVNMHRGQDYVVVIVLDVRERGWQMRLVMVIDQRDGAGDVFVAELLPVLDKLGATAAA